MDSSDKSENLSFPDENDVTMEGDTHSQVFSLDDKTEENFVLTNLCSNEKHFKYTVKIVNKNEHNVQVKFLRKKDNASFFYYTDQPEIYFLGYGKHHNEVTKA